MNNKSLFPTSLISDVSLFDMSLKHLVTCEILHVTIFFVNIIFLKHILNFKLLVTCDKDISLNSDVSN
jgi:hypothetical protein